MGQVAHCRKDAESAEKTCDGIDNDHNQSVSQNRTMELVVRAESDQTSEGDSNRVEDLSSRIHPHLCSKTSFFNRQVANILSMPNFRLEVRI